MALLEIKGLRHRFGGVTALDGADLSVEAGRITGLIGPNGAGKTTLFNAVTGALRPNAGSVHFDGTDVTGWRPDRLTGIGLSRTFQIARELADWLLTGTVADDFRQLGHDRIAQGRLFVQSFGGNRG